MYQALGRH